MQVRPQSFPIAGGICKVQSDRIFIQQSSPVVFLANKWFKGKLSPIYLISGILLVMGCIAAWAIRNYFLAFFLLVFAVYFFIMLGKSRNKSLKNELFKKQVEKVVYHEPIPGKSRGEFVIHFLEENKKFHRYISLATSGKKGLMIAQGAYHIFKDAGLIDKPQNPS